MNKSACKQDVRNETELKRLVYMAYRKLKTHVYYDTTSLFLRKRLAEFDCINFKSAFTKGYDPNVNCQDIFKSEFEKAFKKVFDCLAGNDDVLRDLVESITYKLVLKTVVQNVPWEKEEGGKFITNTMQPGNFDVTKCNAIIDAPIEIHILSVLWLITVGKKLNPVIPCSNYAYRHSLSDSTPVKLGNDEAGEALPSSGLMLFEPYFIGYQQWRDRGIRKAEQELEDNKDVTLLSLDIRRYFYSVRLSVENEVDYWIKSRNLDSLSDFENRLNQILQKVHECYAVLLTKSEFISLSKEDRFEGRYPLPVGLLSSGFLGNLLLTPFDEYIDQTITPAYYGRYVDDILIVFSGKKINPYCTNTNSSGLQSPINYFIQRHLIRKGNNEDDYGHQMSGEKRCSIEMVEKPGDRTDRKIDSYYINCGKNHLELQSEKIQMVYFNHSESRAAINKFKKILDKNRSEFRLLPFETDVNSEFDDAAFKLEYSDSTHRLRDVRAISEDKYGISKYLAQKIFLSLLPFDSDVNEIHVNSKSANQILTFFRGKNSLQMHSLWEKVITYFVIKSDIKSLKAFYHQSLTAIDNIKSTKFDDVDCSEISEELRMNLKEYLNVGLAMALSLVPPLLNNLKSLFNQDIFIEVVELVRALRQSYLFRHNCQYLKAYCYTIDEIGLVGNFNSKKSDYKDIVNQMKPLLGNNLFSESVCLPEINFAKYTAPTFLHIQDISLIWNYQNLNSADDKENTLELLRKIREYFFSFNYDWQTLYSDAGHQRESEYAAREKSFYELGSNDNEKITCGFPYINRICSFEDTKEENVRVNKTIGVVNWRVSERDLEDCLKGSPNKSRSRRNRLFEVLNSAIKLKQDILVFPEGSIPVEWLPLLVDQSTRNNYMIIGGLEYYVALRWVNLSFIMTENAWHIISYLTYFQSKRKDIKPQFPFLEIKTTIRPTKRIFSEVIIFLCRQSARSTISFNGERTISPHITALNSLISRTGQFSNLRWIS